jgi:hypothetical protein
MNPAMHPWWRARLEWLEDNRTDLVVKLFQQGTLAETLKRDLEAALTAVRVQLSKGVPEAEARDQVFETMIAPTPENPGNKNPIRGQIRKQLDQWAAVEEKRAVRMSKETTSSRTKM